jgi:hypothetical protein
MATVTEKRAWLRANTGGEIPSRGRLSPDLEALYDQAHPGDGGDGGITDADFGEEPDGGISGEEEPEVPLQPETPPATPRARRARRRQQPAGRRAGQLAGKLLGTGDKSRPKRPKPRISLEKFTSRGYAMLGRMVTPVSQPMARCLTAQAPMAGVILDDVARGTIADRVLQPVARAEDRLDKVFALTAPPLLVLAIDMTGQLPPKEAAVRQAFLVPMLRESLRISLEVSESYAGRMKAAIKRDEKLDKQVDELIALIFGQVSAQAEPEPQEAGAEAGAQAEPEPQEARQ